MPQSRIAINVWCCSSLSSRLILDDTSPRSPIASSQLSGCRCGHVDVYRIPRITIPPPVPSHFPQASGVCCVYVYTPATGSTLNLTQAERVGLAAMPLPVCRAVARQSPCRSVGSTEWSGALLSSTRIITIISPIPSLNPGGPLSLACNTNNFCI